MKVSVQNLACHTLVTSMKPTSRDPGMLFGRADRSYFTLSNHGVSRQFLPGGVETRTVKYLSTKLRPASPSAWHRGDPNWPEKIVEAKSDDATSSTERVDIWLC